jgi:hypothetical protein
MKIGPIGAKLLRANGRTDKRTDIMKVIDALHNFCEHTQKWLLLHSCQYMALILVVELEHLLVFVYVFWYLLLVVVTVFLKIQVFWYVPYQLVNSH